MATGSPMILPQYMGDYYQLQNQQALAQALMQNALKQQQPMQTVGFGPYQVMPRVSPVSGMSQLASALLGAKMAQSTAQGMNQLGANQWGSLMGMMGGQPQGGAAVPSPQPDASSGVTGAGESAGIGAANAAADQSVPVSAGSGPVSGLNGNAGNASGGLNPLGMNPGFATMMYMNAPDKFFEAQAAAYKPAEIVQQIRAAGIDPNSALGRQVAQQALAKANYIAPVSLRPGGYMYDPMTGQTRQMPHVPDGFTAMQDPNGQWHIVPVEGGIPAMQAASQAQAAGKAAVTPITGYQNGQPVFTNALAASQGGQAGPSAPAVNTGRFAGYTPAGSAGPITPELAPGVATAAEGMASQNTKRSGALVDAASESPMRVNVLDNILGLSQSGVTTGPTAEWKNKVKGALADTIGPDSWKDDVTGFQEMKKFLKQNGLRAWQAAGGSGTDSQLSAAMEANPNDKMFPQAVQTMAKWAKAGELALQAKASAQDAWLARQGNNPAAQNQFESAWRTNFDPRIYQMKLMNGDELNSFVSKLPQAERNALLQKYSTAKQNGWIQ